MLKGKPFGADVYHKYNLDYAKFEVTVKVSILLDIQRYNSENKGLN